MTSSNQPVSIAEWLASRTPVPPPELADRLRRHTENQSCDRGGLSDRLVDIACGILAHVGDDRESAIDLLTADALITYAMEAAAEHGDDAAAEEAMKRIGMVKSA
jgi:hypothetical protein